MIDDQKFENESSYYSDYSYAESMSGVDESFSDYPSTNNGRLLEKKKMKKVRSISSYHRSSNMESSPSRRVRSQPVSARTSGISTPVYDSDANEGFESSSPTFLRQKLSSLKQKRSSPSVKELRRKFETNSKLHNATCSSTLKLAHFTADGNDLPHDHHHHHHGSKSNKELSVMKMCSYAYCNAHVWYHEELPPPPCASRRRQLKSQSHTRIKSDSQRPVIRKSTHRSRVSNNEDSVNEMTTDYCETETDLDIDDGKYKKTYLVPKAFDKILAQQETEAEVSDCDSNKLKSEGTSALNEGIEDNNNSKSGGEIRKDETCVASKPDKKLRKGWNDLKKLILFKRFVKALEEAREFNRRRRLRERPLSRTSSLGTERANIERNITEEEKNAEEWMIDYALQKAIAEPPRTATKRKPRVALLVEAFETVVPLGQLDVHNRRRSLSNRARSTK
ncbi:hypothetical protein PIB30_022656 [Stylosanthes scabra]|uniref:Calmodulin-binding domain-containing protein n=1 Tax=Stylosanthes scabra TaxID=79078 RepID=A0ABU6U878_9FABA|nr:hypothetical protein [Stylosanthes scabra]